MLFIYGIYNYIIFMKQDKPNEAIPYLEKSLMYASSDEEKFKSNGNLAGCYNKIVY